MPNLIAGLPVLYNWKQLAIELDNISVEGLTNVKSCISDLVIADSIGGVFGRGATEFHST
jgi:hypothetical protein